MRIRGVLLALTILPAAVLSLAAEPADGCYFAVEDDPATTDTDESVEVCELATWFHAPETKVGNLGNVDGAPHGNATFDTNAPADSVAAGAGAGYYANSLATQVGGTETTLAVFEGTFTGLIDAIDVDLHALAGTAHAFGNESLNITLELDGNVLASVGDVAVPAVEEPNASAAVRFDFALTDLIDTMLLFPNPDGEHTVRLLVEPTYAGDGHEVFVFDTTEVPGGITFNPVALPDDSTVVN